MPDLTEAPRTMRDSMLDGMRVLTPVGTQGRTLERTAVATGAEQPMRRPMLVKTAATRMEARMGVRRTAEVKSIPSLRLQPEEAGLNLRSTGF